MEETSPNPHQEQAMANPLQHPEPVALMVTEEMRSHFYEMSKWTKFLGILGFVISGIMLIAALGAGFSTAFFATMGSEQLAKLGGGTLTFVFVFYAAFTFYPSLLMYHYSAKAKTGILYGEQSELNKAVGYLKSLFKFWGIVTLIFISLYALIFISLLANL